MTSSRVSCMLLFFLVLLVFPHIDEVVGAQMEHRKLKETNHADQVTDQKNRVSEGIRKAIDWARRNHHRLHPRECPRKDKDDKCL